MANTNDIKFVYTESACAVAFRLEKIRPKARAVLAQKLKVQTANWYKKVVVKIVEACRSISQHSDALRTCRKA